MRHQLALLTLISAVLGVAAPARAFCGFYVAKADAKLFNHASQVVLVRDGPRTVLTMSNDYQGDLSEFAVVVPVPSVLTREQIHIGDAKLVKRIDGYSAPRLVEYHDPDPCTPQRENGAMRAGGPMPMSLGAMGAGSAERARALGVTIEAQYTVGEYDIILLSAKQSGGLETWLREEGYRIPSRAAEALSPYVKQNMKFFVAKVNLKEQAKTGYQNLRPIQMAYESEKFMLPIRLGMANARPGESQDLLVYTLTRKGRVESTNYRTVKVPSGEDVPLFVKDDFAAVYKAIFDRVYENEGRRSVQVEYVWNSSGCDPCADDPLTAEELRGLGVFWLQDANTRPTPTRPGGFFRPPLANTPVVTRLHIRYDREHFPEDLVFQETGDQQSFQARYVLNYPFSGSVSCEAGKRYLESVDERRHKELDTLATLTGWSRELIVQKMGDNAPGQAIKPEQWWKRIWP